MGCIALLVFSRHKILCVLFINNPSCNASQGFCVRITKRTKLSEVNSGYKSDYFLLEFLKKIRALCRYRYAGKM